MNTDHHVTVDFGPGVSPAEQGPLLLAFERMARQMTGKPVEVFKHRMGDDSKLRRSMTSEERAKL